MNLTDLSLTVGTIVLGIIVGGLVNWLVRPAWLKNSVLVAVVTVSVILLVYFTVLKDGLKGAPVAAPSSQNSPSSTTSAVSVPESTPAPETTATSTRRATTTPVTGSSGARVSTPQTQYLSELKAVTNHYGAKVGSAEIDHKAYPNSMWITSGGCPNSKYSVEYDIDRDHTVFSAWIGLKKESTTGFKLHFQVYLDDVPYDAGVTMATFQPAQRIEVPVAGKHRIKLASAWISGGTCNSSGSIGYATWGDAQLAK